MAEKAPAFQFYAKDFLIGTATMSLAERGAYVTLLAFQWDKGAVPSELAEVSRLWGCSVPAAKKLWAVVGSKFALGADGWYRNTRLEQEREKQAAFRTDQSTKGKAGATKRWNASGHSTGYGSGHDSVTVRPIAGRWPEDSSPVSDLRSPSPEVPLNQQDLRRESPQGGPLIVSPMAYFKQHGQHVDGFCDWMCLPRSSFTRFVNLLIGAGATEESAERQARVWATSVRQAWVGRIPGDDIFKFWDHEWAATHGSNKPAPGAIDVLAGLR